MTLSKPLTCDGGSVWESNPPSRGLAPITGFEVQAAHQHRYASAVFFKGLQGRMGSSSTPCCENCWDFFRKTVQDSNSRPLVTWCQVRIAECHRDVLVSHQFFHGRQVYSPHHEA